MALTEGSQLGPYTIDAPIGAGGMGEVYKGHDPRLNRTVAIKVLPSETADNASAATRFEREARAVAALNHPNILSIFDFGTDDGRAYATMELLEGRTLRQRLQAGALPTRKAVEYAAAIARGLAAAHEKGIVHRDLKPENVIITHDEQVKILDFGLAKQTLAGDGQTMSLDRGTSPGTVLGTVGYMSPEQVRGKEADGRSDVFALGAMLYEMLSGERAFHGDSAVETMSAILKHEPPDLTQTNHDLPAGLERVVRHCLEKRPEARFQSASDLAFDLESGSWGSSASQRALDYPQPAASRINKWVALAACLALGAAAFFGGLRMRGEESTPEPVKVRPLTFSGADLDPVASPDRRFLAFTSTRDGISRIWLKQFAGGGEQVLTPGSDEKPRFAADGSSVFYIHEEGGEVAAHRVPLVGGQPRKIMDDVHEIDPSPDGRRIAFLRTSDVPDGAPVATLGTALLAGTEEQVLLQTDNGVFSGVQWSPDGSRIAVTRWPLSGAATGFALVVVDVATGESTEIPGNSRALSAAIWSADGRSLIYAEAPNTVGSLTAAPARVVARNLASGTERTLFWSQGLFPFRGFRGAATTLSRAGPGRIIFDTSSQPLRLTEVALGNGAIRTLTGGIGVDRQPAYSLDGSKVVFTSNRSGNLDIWTVDRDSGVLRQLTDDSAQDWDPGFTPDGRHVLFSSDRGGNMEVWMANADGTGARQVTNDGVGAENPTLTLDGEWIVYSSGGPETVGIWKTHPDGTGSEQLVSGERTNPEVSPNGRYALFVNPANRSDASLVNVVDIQTGELVDFSIRIPRSSIAANVTYGRGRWMPDGNAIAYLGADSQRRTGIYVQDFEPGVDTSHTRRKLAGFFDDSTTESFGISPDGSHVTLAVIDATSSVMLAEGVPE